MALPPQAIAHAPFREAEAIERCGINIGHAGIERLGERCGAFGPVNGLKHAAKRCRPKAQNGQAQRCLSNAAGWESHSHSGSLK